MAKGIKFKATEKSQSFPMNINGDPVGVRNLKGKIVDRLNGYFLIECDLDFSLNLAKHLLTLREEDLRKNYARALFHSSIMSYAKCFTHSKGRGVKLEKDLLKGCKDSLIDVHDELIQLRHQYIAHGGDKDGYEQVKTVVLLRKDKSNPKYYGVGSFPLQILGGDIDQVNTFVDLLKKVKTVVVKKKEELFNRVKSEVDMVPLDKLYETDIEIELNEGVTIEKG